MIRLKLYRDEFIKLVLSMPVDMSFDIQENDAVQCGETRYYLDIQTDWWGKSIDSQGVQV